MAFNPKAHMMNMRGNDYLEVKWRIVWFRDEHPGGQILTEMVNLDPLVMKATVYDADGNPLASGFGSADSDGKRVVWSGREIEKAETAAIGRALAHAGFGTQFTGEVEGDHLADAPVRSGGSAKTTRFPDGAKQDGGASVDSGSQGEATANQLTNVNWNVFWGKVRNELGLSSDEAHKAAGVDSMKDYPGTEAELLAKLKAYADRPKAS